MTIDDKLKDDTGMQVSVVNHSRTMYGVSVGTVNKTRREMGGLQLSLGYNLNYEDSSGIQIAVLANGTTEMNGVQVSVINSATKLHGMQLGGFNYVESGAGIQLGAMNVAPEEFDGVQIGAICYAREGNYVQLGLLTIHGEGPWYKRISPVIGFHRQKNSEIL